MSDQTLTDLLERAADRTAVDPPPLDLMLRGVRRRRRRRAVAGGVVLTVAAVVVAIVVPVLANPHDRSGPPPESVPTTGSPTPPPSTPPSAVDLEGSWVITGIRGWNGPLGVRARIRFEGGRLVADDTCNTISGRYRLDGSQFRVGHDLATTLVGCLRPVPPLFERLEAVRSVARDPGSTFLEDADGKVLIALARR